MLSISRFARIFLVALILVTVPTAFIFYPASSSKEGEVTDKLDQGGIDSAHWRDPVMPETGDFSAGRENDAGKAVVDKENFAGDTGSAAEGKGGKEGKEGKEGKDGKESKESNEGSLEYSVPQDVISGAVIMPHLGNATAKAELGRAAWRVLHLMTLRYPELPTPDDRAALKSFFYLFSRLYPCGECAEHFQKMLKKYPPQTSSRKAASMWLCSVHNIVNERLHKPEFDCLTLNDVYDCGCANETSSAVSNHAKETGKATSPIGY